MTQSKLYIDSQILQTRARHRGMGKYTAKFLEALSKDYKSKYSQVELIFNKNLEAPDDSILTLFKSKAVFLDLPIDVSADFEHKRQEAKKIITERISRESGPVEFLITAPFFVDFFAEFPEGDVIKSVIAYDIIPYKIWKIQRIFPDDLYAQHFSLYIDADKILTISESVKSDLVSLLGVQERKTFSINGGPFTVPKSGAGRAATRLKKPYILMPSAPIIHKNNERAVAAFSEFNGKNGERYTLYITSTFDEPTKASLQKQSPKVKFTGNISDEELLGAYENAEAVLFASFSEGLGMPVLEAISCGVPVACSNIHVLAEISKTAMYLFNPTDVSSIASSLERASKKENWQSNNSERKKVLSKYTWQKAVKIFLNSEGVLGKQSKKTLIVRCDNPNQDTLSGALIESSCLGLGEAFSVSLDMEKNISPVRPSISSYLFPVEKEKDHVLVVRQRPIDRVLGRKKIQICIQGAPNKNLTLECRSTIYDEGLKIEKPTFFLEDKEFQPQNLVKWIEQELTRK